MTPNEPVRRGVVTLKHGSAQLRQAVDGTMPAAADTTPGELDAPPAAATTESAAPMATAAPRVTAATPSQRPSRSVFLPTLLALLALVAWMGFQAWALWSDREALQASVAQQQPLVDNSAKLRASLDALATDTQRLAQAGNPGAKLLVEELRRRGVTINPSAAPAEKR